MGVNLGDNINETNAQENSANNHYHVTMKWPMMQTTSLVKIRSVSVRLQCPYTVARFPPPSEFFRLWFVRSRSSVRTQSGLARPQLNKGVSMISKLGTEIVDLTSLPPVPSDQSDSSIPPLRCSVRT